MNNSYQKSIAGSTSSINNKSEFAVKKLGHLRRFTYFVLVLFFIFTGILSGCSVKDSPKDAAELPNTAEKDKTVNEKGLSENPFVKAEDNNLSTFSIDVDNASYINFRKHISQMSLKEFQSNKYTIRTEEAINYFTYEYEKPKDGKPIAVTTLVGDCPWNSKAKLGMITLAGENVDTGEHKGSNIVFLLDVSGSMNQENKLPLLQKSICTAVDNLNNKDIISIVTYASGVETVLEGVKGTEKEKIKEAVNSLEANGSTAGSSGLETAYTYASEYFIKGGNNRIILATDGEFNVGPSSIDEMKSLITEKRDSGIYITVVGFGISYTGGDERLEVIADNGNGGYFGVDSIEEGKKIFSDQLSGLLFTVAKDVKLQVEFNKNAVEKYRLIGYENRVLETSDFADDTKDAGDLGSGQTVTALYEIILKENPEQDIFKVNVRYKKPDSETSELFEHKAQASQNLTDDFYFVSAVAETCLLVNDSEYKGSASFEHAYSTAKDHAKGDSSKLEFCDIINKLTGK